jgi:hypothetical protein
VQFVGIEAYQVGGGAIMRDLFQQDDGGWLQDPVLLDRLVAEKLEREAGVVRAEGGKWVEVATDFPYGHTYGLRHISGEPVAMSDEELATAEALRANYDKLEQAHSNADELPKRSISGLAKSRPHLPRSTIGLSSMTPRKSHALASSSASTARAFCAWSAATYGRRTSQPFPNPNRRRARRTQARSMRLRPKARSQRSATRQTNRSQMKTRA